MSSIETLTSVLGFSVDDVQRALARCAGDIERAAELLLEGGLRRCAASKCIPTKSETAGSSTTPPTSQYKCNGDALGLSSPNNDDSEGICSSQSGTSIYTSPATTTTEDSDAEHSEPDSNQDYLYISPTPIQKQYFSQPITCNTTTSAHHYHNSGASSNVKNEYAQCVCTLPDNDEMIQCTTCERWFHYECVHFTSSTIPNGNYYCHFESNSNTTPYNNAGNRMNDVESRALYLTVKHFAPLGPKFWENVSQYMLSNFHIVRSVTSVKMEWLRYGSAWWGFDERCCKQYGEGDREAREALYRSNQKDQASPSLLWKFLGMEFPGAEVAAAKRVRKSRTWSKSTEKPRTSKRRHVIVEDDDDSEIGMLVASMKRAKTLHCAPAPPPIISGKYVEAQEIFVSPALQRPMAKKTIRKADFDGQSGQFVGSHANNSAALAQVGNSKLASISSSAEADVLVTAPMIASEYASIGVDSEQRFTPGVFDETLLPACYPAAGLFDYHYCTESPAPSFQSRFDALAEHRRYVKDFLRDIEPDLDWYEGPWPEHKSELLWVEDDELQYSAMFTT